MNLLLFFAFFFKKQFSEIINFWQPQWAAENKHELFSAALVFGGCSIDSRK
jgi:hypothetical protein